MVLIYLTSEYTTQKRQKMQNKPIEYCSIYMEPVSVENYKKRKKRVWFEEIKAINHSTFRNETDNGKAELLG